ncbi:unnamed protein product [Phytophthora lilii]|uniref:RxLR effector protein n=1 Tax=Phytophthora lilii TaxID=2077276 RepID=A0A9W6WEF4_9STRA|nr:unnamed protein product [Phytophthora lilii]
MVVETRTSSYCRLLHTDVDYEKSSISVLGNDCRQKARYSSHKKREVDAQFQVPGPVLRLSAALWSRLSKTFGNLLLTTSSVTSYSLPSMRVCFALLAIVVASVSASTLSDTVSTEAVYQNETIQEDSTRFLRRSKIEDDTHESRDDAEERGGDSAMKWAKTWSRVLLERTG